MIFGRAKHSKRANIVHEFFQPESPEGTEFRRLFSRLSHAHQSGKLNKLLVTSSTVSEGKSTIAAMLSATIAEFETSRCVLVDCDLRRPRVHEMFGHPRHNGTTDVLQNRAAVMECVVPTHLERLHLLVAGKTPDNPSELLSANNIRRMLVELRQHFDMIVIDSPPLLPVSDPVVLGREVDGTLLVIKAGTTPRSVVQRAVTLLRDAGIPIVGVTVNNSKEVLPYYYNAKYYGYEYR